MPGLVYHIRVGKIYIGTDETWGDLYIALLVPLCHSGMPESFCDVESDPLNNRVKPEQSHPNPENRSPLVCSQLELITR